MNITREMGEAAKMDLTTRVQTEDGGEAIMELFGEQDFVNYSWHRPVDDTALCLIMAIAGVKGE